MTATAAKRARGIRLDESTWKRLARCVEMRAQLGVEATVSATIRDELTRYERHLRGLVRKRDKELDRWNAERAAAEARIAAREAESKDSPD